MPKPTGSRANGEVASTLESRLAIRQELPTTQRGRRTRGALVAAARELFEQRGFFETRISDIAKLSKTSYGSFYHYFETKEAVLHELFTTVAGEMFNASRTGTQGATDPVGRIAAANRQYFAVAARNAKLVSVIDEVAIRDPQFKELKLQIRDLFLSRNERAIRNLQDEGLVDPKIDPALTAAALGGMVEHFTQMWFIYGVTFDEGKSIETLTSIWARALGLPEPETS